MPAASGLAGTPLCIARAVTAATAVTAGNSPALGLRVARLAWQAGAMARVLVSGASGFLGSELLPALITAGHRVRRLVRRAPQSSEEVCWDPVSGHLPASALSDVDAVINLSGAGVGDRRWTGRRKHELLESRVAPTTLLARSLADTGRSEIPFLTASAVGYYSDRGEDHIAATDGPGSSFLAGLCTRWEAAADPALRAGHRVVHLRTGIVLDTAGGALQQLLLPLRCGVAGPIAGGRQWWPWITRRDWVRAVVHLVDSPIAGPVHLAAPQPRRNKDVMQALAAAVHRPAALPIPSWAVRAVAGEFAGELAISQYLTPEKLQADGFDFTWPQLETAAAHLLQHPRLIA